MLDMAACAAFRKESRMKFANVTNQAPYCAVCVPTAAAFPGPPTAWILGIL
jgi:hypothetical protein